MDTDKFLFGNMDSGIIVSIALRTFVMFLIILIFLRLLGRRGIKQLSIFELVVILGLGSAAGDPMIYEEIGIGSALITFIVIALSYKILTHLVFRYKSLENLVEGKAVFIIKKGTFAISDFEKQKLSKDEFFMELRVRGVYHLGQVEYAILEISGEVSVYFFPEKQIKYGLPILPGSLKKTTESFEQGVYYSCTFCGETIKFQDTTPKACPKCKKNEWIKSSKRKVST